MAVGGEEALLWNGNSNIQQIMEKTEGGLNEFWIGLQKLIEKQHGGSVTREATGRDTEMDGNSKHSARVGEEYEAWQATLPARRPERCAGSLDYKQERGITTAGLKEL